MGVTMWSYPEETQHWWATLRGEQKLAGRRIGQKLFYVKGFSPSKLQGCKRLQWAVTFQDTPQSPIARFDGVKEETRRRAVGRSVQAAPSDETPQVRCRGGKSLSWQMNPRQASISGHRNLTGRQTISLGLLAALLML